MMRPATIAALLALAALACGHKDEAATAQPDAAPSDVCAPDAQLQGKCDTLAGYGLFADAPRQIPAPGVTPYDVVAPLFSDYAVKHRFLKVPAGATMTYDPDAPWALPVGAIAVKTFAYPRDARDPSQGERLVETRLLIRGTGGLVPITYHWDEAQTRALRTIAGVDVSVAWIDSTGASRTGNFGVPNTNQCLRCHGKTPTLLGVKTRQLNRDYDFGSGPENEIDHLAKLGVVVPTGEAGARDALVSPSDPMAPVDKRARSYLDANCGHCHNTNAAADWSGLELDWDALDPGRIGVCKTPSSAGDTGGRTYDLVPGNPDASVIPYRMALVGSAYRMPESSRVADGAGVEIVRQWIAAMPPKSCP